MKATALLRSVALAVLGICLPSAKAGLIFQHQGATDPVLEGFRPSIPPGARVGPVTNDFGRDAWFISAGFAPAGYTYLLDAGKHGVLTEASWELSATLRIARAEHADLALFLPGNRFLITFGVQPDGDPVLWVHSAANIVWAYEGGGSGYHDYALRFDHNAGTASLNVDGVDRVSGITGQSGWGAWGATWGYNAQSSSTSLVYWNAITLSVIPEPTSGAVFALGVLGICLLRCRFRRKSG